MNLMNGIIKFQDKRDNELVEIILGGNVTAYETLIHKYEKLVYNLAFGKLRSSEAATEVSKECFIQVYKELAYCRSEGSYLAAVYRICNGLIHRYYQNHIGFSDSPRNISGGTDNHIESVRGALLSLPGEYREVIIMRDIGGISCGEIAQLTGADLAAVKLRITLARTQLKEIL